MRRRRVGGYRALTSSACRKRGAVPGAEIDLSLDACAHVLIRIDAVGVLLALARKLRLAALRDGCVELTTT